LTGFVDLYSINQVVFVMEMKVSPLRKTLNSYMLYSRVYASSD